MNTKVMMSVGALSRDGCSQMMISLYGLMALVNFDDDRMHCVPLCVYIAFFPVCNWCVLNTGSDNGVVVFPSSLRLFQRWGCISGKKDPTGAPRSTHEI